MSMLIVRFYVGTKEEDAIVQTYNKLYSNFDRIPQGVSQPLIKVAFDRQRAHPGADALGKELRRLPVAAQIAAELDHSLKQLDDVSETAIIGGQTRKVRVILDTQKLSAYGLTPGAVVAQLGAANTRSQAGSFAGQQSGISSGSRKLLYAAGRACSKLSSAFTQDGPSICATSRKKSRTARPSRQLRSVRRRKGSDGKRGERRISGRHHHAGQAQRRERHADFGERAEEDR